MRRFDLTQGPPLVLRLPDGREVRVYLVAIRDGRACLGFEAARDVRVVREEVRRGWR